MLKLGWFSTGRGEGSRRLLELVLKQIASGDLSVTIEFVFQNRERGEAEGSDQFQDLVRSYGIPLATLSSQRFRKGRGAGSFSEVRLEFDREVIRLLEGYQPNLSVLAGYMLYTADELCKHFTMINSHPALPDGPIGTWQQVIWQLINQQANETGAMIHLATEEWDRGPVISYFSFPLRGPLLTPCGSRSRVAPSTICGPRRESAFLYSSVFTRRAESGSPICWWRPSEPLLRGRSE